LTPAPKEKGRRGRRRRSRDKRIGETARSPDEIPAAERMAAGRYEKRIVVRDMRREQCVKKRVGQRFVPGFWAWRRFSMVHTIEAIPICWKEQTGFFCSDKNGLSHPPDGSPRTCFARKLFIVSDDECVV